MADSIEEFTVSNDILDDPVRLRQRLDAEGYLFIRDLQDPALLAALRLDILQVCRAGGWIRAGTDLEEGIADISQRCTEGNIEYTDVYHEIYKLESFHRAAHVPVVLDTMSKIIGRTALPHPQKIARLWFPQYTDHTTPVHQDFVHFQGAFETYTCWTPLSACPLELGGLAVLPGSHKIDAVHDHHFSLGAGGLAIDDADLDSNWATTNYALGDTLIFHSLTVHKALPNLTPDRLRISLDNRYSAIDQPLAAHMLEPHLARFSPLDWEAIYQGWASTDLQYYWRDLDLQILPKDESWAGTGFREALERGQRGDEDALFALRRVIGRDPTTEQARAAREVLQTAAAPRDH